MKRIALRWLSGLLLCSAVPLVKATEVRAYALRLQVDVDSGRIRGQETIAVDNDARKLTLDIGDLMIDRVRAGSQPLYFHVTGKQLSVDLPDRPTPQRRISIDYHGAPTSGLEFHPERREAYTIFSTSQWMPSVDAPDARATLDLTLVTHSDLTVVASGHPRGRSTAGNGWTAHRWTLDAPNASFLYAFAIGPYERISLDSRKPDMAVFAIAANRTALREAFSGTREMLEFMQDEAGIPYPQSAYTQVLVANTIGQEAAGMALFSADHAEALMRGEADETLLAHELAHQWWGALLTCRDWGHFWLNEGFATFMAAAWIEQRRGGDAYLARVDAWRAEVTALQASGEDHALVFDHWRPTPRNRSIAYRKGALFLHTLRESLGDAVFWRGIRNYTRRHAGRSVTTIDFKRAMEDASGRDLSALFAAWVGETGH